MMAIIKEKEESKGLLDLLKQQDEKLQTNVSMDFDEQFKSYQMEREKGIESDKETVQQSLDGTINRGNEFKAIVGEMNVALSKYFNQYNEELGGITEYKGLIENIASKFSFTKTWADKKVYERLQEQPLDKSTSQMLIHGKKVSEIIDREVGKMSQAYKLVTLDKNEASKQFDEAQEKLEEWEGKEKKLKLDLDAITESLQVADDTERAKLQLEFDETKLAYDDASTRVNDYRVTVNKAKEHIPLLEKHLESYIQIIKDLKGMSTNIKQDVLHYKNILPEVQRVYEAVLATKGADVFGEQVRATVNQATQFVGNATNSIAKTAAKMQTAEAMSDAEFNAVYQDIVNSQKIYEDAFAEADRRSEERQKNRKSAY